MCNRLNIALLLLFVFNHSLAGAEFEERVQPFLKRFCISCHSQKAKKGGLDLQRFQTLKQIRRDIEPWQSVLEMLETDQMPPQGKPQPSQAQRQRIAKWLTELLSQEAKRRAGDPGPLLLRRLSNSEYRYSIRDLTKYDLNVGREFAPDGAAGEGFLNATSALTISPERLSRYLKAAKEVAAHAVLLPKGFRFSRSKFREDWVNEAMARINGLYHRYGTTIGGVPLQRYFTALNSRRAVKNPSGLQEIAAANRLSAKYLQVLSNTMHDQRSSLFLDGVRDRWSKRASMEDLVAHINAVQAILWHKRVPNAVHALSDRFVPTSVALITRRKLRLSLGKPKGAATFYLATRTLTGSKGVGFIVHRPRLEGGKKPMLLRTAIAAAKLPRKSKATALVKPLRIEQFGRHPADKKFDKDSLVLGPNEILAVRLPRNLATGRTFVADVEIDSSSPATTLAMVDVRGSILGSQVDRGLRWQYREGASTRQLLARQKDKSMMARLQRGANEFRQIFPVRIFYPGLIVRDTVVTLERFHRGDSHLSRLFLNKKEQAKLDLFWHELHYISRDAVQVKNSIATLTQGEMRAYKQLQKIVDQRAKQTLQDLVTSQPSHLRALTKFAARAYRRSLTDADKQALKQLYGTLRQKKLPHEVALRSALARVLVSPRFLYRIEQPQPGRKPARVSDWELATRLSYFIWSSIPDKELWKLAAKKKLSDPKVLLAQAKRLLSDERSRALAIEFGTQWLEVRAFDSFQGKDEKLFPSFDRKLRQSMNEESIRLFADLFQSDRLFRELLISDHTFLNERLAKHYGIPGVKGKKFRKVVGVARYGRGGILGLASVQAKHSGAARTSPVLRGNWISEALLGDKLPRPPDGVPKLPEAETGTKLSIRQLVEQHAKVAQCAVCHQRIDPLGFALEGFDTIGRLRKKDLGGRDIDDNAKLSDGTKFKGIAGLKKYLLTARKQDFTRQFSRKLLGYALGRRVLLSDRQLLQQIQSILNRPDARVSEAIFAIVRSRQFQYNRGYGQ